MQYNTVTSYNSSFVYNEASSGVECPVDLEVDATTTPNDWVLVEGANKVVAVNRPFDAEESYIQSTGTNSEQWYTLGDAGFGGSTVPINEVHVLVCHRSADPLSLSSFLLHLGTTDDSTTFGILANIGSGCDWFCESYGFDCKPWTKFCTPFDWDDIDKLKVGVMNLNNRETDISLIRVTVNCGDQGTPCVRCCCCCLCNYPVVEITEGSIVFNYLDGSGDHPIPGFCAIVPFQEYSLPPDARCTHATPEAWEDTHCLYDANDGKWCYQGISISSDILEPDISSCATVFILVTFQLPLGGGLYGPPANVLIQSSTFFGSCETTYEGYEGPPFHYSEGDIDAVSVGGVTKTCGVDELVSCDGTVSISCELGLGGSKGCAS